MWIVDDSLATSLDQAATDVEVRIEAGEVVVTAGDQPAVEVEVVRGDPLTVEVDGPRVDIRYDGPWPRRHLHRKAVVAVTAGPGATVKVTTASASIVVAGVTGEVSAQTASGDVTLDGLGGRVRVRTASGDVEARHLSGPLSCRTASGELTLAASRCGSVTAAAVSGDLLLDLDPQPGGTYQLNTVSGRVALRLAGDAGLVVDASTLTGHMEWCEDFPLDHWRRGPVGQRLTGTVGDADAELRIKTVSGAVALVAAP
jgi:Putative adhesin